MTLVLTARIGARDPDVLDITRKSAPPSGEAFAPSWSILRPAIAARKRADEILDAIGDLDTDLEDEARRLLADAWAAYVPAYLREMRASYRHARARWDALLARERVVLVCYCTDADRCHRTILARDVLPRLGATYDGELGAARACDMTERKAGAA